LIYNIYKYKEEVLFPFQKKEQYFFFILLFALVLYVSLDPLLSISN